MKSQQPQIQSGPSVNLSSQGHPDGPDPVCYTWSAGGQLLLRAPPRQPGRQKVGHVSLMEARLGAVDELALELRLSLQVRALGRACAAVKQINVVRKAGTP